MFSGQFSLFIPLKECPLWFYAKHLFMFWTLDYNTDNTDLVYSAAHLDALTNGANTGSVQSVLSVCFVLIVFQ